MIAVGKPAGGALPEARIAAFKDRLIASVLGRLSTAVEGHRNSTLNALAFMLGRWVASGLLTEAEALDVLAHSTAEEREELAPRALAKGQGAAFAAADFVDAPASRDILALLDGNAPAQTARTAGPDKRSASKPVDRAGEIVRQHMANLRRRRLEARRTRNDARAEQPSPVVEPSPVTAPVTAPRVAPSRATNCYDCTHCRRASGKAPSRRFARRGTHGDCRRLDDAPQPGPLAWLARAQSCTDFTPVGAA